VGDAIELVVYRDAGGDPTDGAELVAAYPRLVEAADGATYSVYPLGELLAFDQGEDVLIGVVDRWVATGITPPLSPATLDLDASAGRSFFAVWPGDPPTPPTLASADLVIRIDDFLPAAAGNWLIRGFASAPPAEIPTLGSPGLLVLALALGSLGLHISRKRRIEVPRQP